MNFAYVINAAQSMLLFSLFNLLSCVYSCLVALLNHANKAAELNAASTVSTCGRDLLDVFQVIYLIDFHVAHVFFRHGRYKAYRFRKEVCT